MSRAAPWRRVCPENVSSRIEEALASRIYLLNQTGPTGFVLREEDKATKYKVVLGDLHSCSCATFRQERELCVHILWVILKKFRVPRDDPVVFQLSLVEREVNALLCRHARCSAALSEDSGGKGACSNPPIKERMQQKEIAIDDVCPVCYDELLASTEALSYCSHSCGKSVHVKCMKMWAEHQTSTGAASIKCPLCREDYGPIEVLHSEARRSSRLRFPAERHDIHYNITCRHCNVSPIIGKCYRCTLCTWYHLCSTCFQQQVHTEHSFQFKQKCLSRWRLAVRSRGQQLPAALVSDIQSRELTADDYDLLNQLDSSTVEPLPRHVVESFPVERLRDAHPLLSPGVQCKVCLCRFEVLQLIRVLPCRHRFHVTCIDQWLTSERGTCPVDGLSVPRIIYTKKRKPRTVNPSKAEQTESTKSQCKQGPSLLPPLMGQQCNLSVCLSGSTFARHQSVTLQRVSCEMQKKLFTRRAVPPSIPSKRQAHLPSLLVTNGLSETKNTLAANRDRKATSGQFRLRPMVGRQFQSPGAIDTNHLCCIGLRQQ